MEIQALGYLGIGTIKIDDWTSLATRGHGMQVVDRGAGLRAFRMDDRRQRLVIDSTMPENTRYFGWEVANAEALDALAAARRPEARCTRACVARTAASVGRQLSAPKGRVPVVGFGHRKALVGVTPVASEKVRFESNDDVNVLAEVRCS